MAKKLNLRRETLTELSADELATVAGGVILTPVVNTMPLDQCIKVASVGAVERALSIKCDPSYQPSCLCTPPA
jgi:hypothetical protein